MSPLQEAKAPLGSLGPRTASACQAGWHAAPIHHRDARLQPATCSAHLGRRAVTPGPGRPRAVQSCLVLDGAAQPVSGRRHRVAGLVGRLTSCALNVETLCAPNPRLWPGRPHELLLRKEPPAVCSASISFPLVRSLSAQV